MSNLSKMTESDFLAELEGQRKFYHGQSDIIAKLRTGLLNIDGTARKWAVANGGDTPLALIAKMARETLGVTTEQADTEIRRINAGLDCNG